MMLRDLVAHEKKCRDRTIKCPYSGCAQVVKLKNFDDHALGDDVKHSTIVEGSWLKWNIGKINEDNVVHHMKWSLMVMAFI